MLPLNRAPRRQASPSATQFQHPRRPRRHRGLAAGRLFEVLEPRLLLAADLLTYHNDNGSTGQNLAEAILTPANVNSGSFGKLFSASVDGQVYAQPLYKSGLNITVGPNAGVHNVAFVATEHDSLYALDADTGALLWKDSFINPAAGVTTVPAADVGTDDLTPEIGITGTPVIDPSSNTLYLTAKTKQVINGNTHYVYRLHAINLSSGAEELGGPVVIADTIYNGSRYTYVSGPTVNGTGQDSINGRITFSAHLTLERTALTLTNGTIYIGFGAHGDSDPHGWVLGYNAQTLQLTAAFCDTPNGQKGGIWGGGARVATDAQGNLYVATGNGTFDTTFNSSGLPINGDYGDSIIKLAPDPNSSPTNQNINGWGLKVVDYFTPSNQASLSNQDLDLGSGGVLLLPDSAGSATYPHLLVQSGKEGTIYLINRDNMGHYSSNADHVVQKLPGAIAGSFGTPAYFSNTLYYVASGYGTDVAKAFSISNATLSGSPTSRSSDSFGFPGSTPSISANGSSNAVVWDLDKTSNQLRAYDAGSYARELYTSAQAANGRDQLGSAIKFSVPTVLNGKVYVGTSNALVAYGLLNPVAPPAVPQGLSAQAISPTQVSLSWSASAGAASYTLYRGTTANGEGATPYRTGLTTTTFSDTGLQAGTTYYYQVTAANTAGQSARSTEASATPTSASTGGLSFATGFAAAGGQLALNGSTTIQGSALQLTDGGGSEASSAFSSAALDVSRFTTSFSFQLLPGTSPVADGLTFTIQGAGPTARGYTGGSLGYGVNPSTNSGGIARSVAVKFDLYSNQGEGVDSTGLYTNGLFPGSTGSLDLTPTGINLASGHVLNTVMTYDGTTLRVTITDATTNASASQSYAVNIPAVVGSSTAYVGFTAGTGGLTARQSILSWTYTPTSTTPTPTIPAAPQNPTASAVSASQINLSWSASSGATSYNVYRGTTANGEGATPYRTGLTTTTFSDTGLQAGTTYYYQVTAANTAGQSARSTEASATTTTSSGVGGLNFSGGFASAGSQLTTNGYASIQGSALRLTDGGTTYEASSAFSSRAVDVSHFTTSFSFQLLPGTTPMADGFTFAIQSVGPNALSYSGGSLGYGPADGAGSIPSRVPRSVAVKFDLYSNEGEGNDSTGLYTNGAFPGATGSVDLTPTGIDLHSGHVFNATMTYDGTVLRVTITDTATHASASQSYTLNIPAVVGSSSAYVGFTAGTGGQTAQQSILSWTYTPTTA